MGLYEINLKPRLVHFKRESPKWRFFFVIRPVFHHWIFLREYLLMYEITSCLGSSIPLGGCFRASSSSSSSMWRLRDGDNFCHPFIVPSEWRRSWWGWDVSSHPLISICLEGYIMWLAICLKFFVRFEDTIAYFLKGRLGVSSIFSCGIDNLRQFGYESTKILIKVV